VSPRNIVITIDGPAASGKTSTADLVAQALGYRHIDSGAMYRAETARRLGAADIRCPEVTAEVSRIAKIPEVRAEINAAIRAIAAEEHVVADGRDMGNAVFPDAPLKIFLVADAAERAKRRLLQRLGREGTELEIAEERRLLIERDERDATQTFPARDAVILDTTHLTQVEQVRQIVSLAQKIQRALVAG
jgi:cytidylate kinase